MSVELLFQFADGPRGVIVFDYDHFGHASRGRWSTMCPLVGRSNEGAPNPAPGRPAGSGGTFEVVGGLCSMYERGEGGGTALAAELRYFPKLGGVSAEDMRAREFEGPFRIYRAHLLQDPRGVWSVQGAASHCMDYNWALTRPT
jgi:hypothetical protein